MIVVDTSALVAAIAAPPGNEPIRARLEAADTMHAPHLIDVEFLNVLRRFVGSGRISREQARVGLNEFGETAIVRYPHVRLRDRMWELRANMSAYDAAFVALAEALGMPLVTTDGRLARSTGHSAVIELF